MRYPLNGSPNEPIFSYTHYRRSTQLRVKKRRMKRNRKLDHSKRPSLRGHEAPLIEKIVDESGHRTKIVCQ